MLLDEELMMWQCFNHFQNFCANQNMLWCKFRSLINALLISKCFTACCPCGLASAPCINNCCTACYSRGLASASHISRCCITCYLCGLVYAALLCSVACNFNKTHCLNPLPKHAANLSRLKKTFSNQMFLQSGILLKHHFFFLLPNNWPHWWKIVD